MPTNPASSEPPGADEPDSKEPASPNSLSSKPAGGDGPAKSKEAPSPNPGSSLSSSGGSKRALQAAKVIIVGSVMFTFISYWRTAAIVLCDLASTAYYIGGIVEQAIGQ